MKLVVITSDTWQKQQQQQQIKKKCAAVHVFAFLSSFSFIIKQPIKI